MIELNLLYLIELNLLYFSVAKYACEVSTPDFLNFANKNTGRQRGIKI
jgi:hypothetical protein